MGIYYSYRSDGFFWFRIFGRGLCFKNVKKHGLTFSQRMGIKKTFIILNWSIQYLPNCHEGLLKSKN